MCLIGVDFVDCLSRLSYCFHVIVYLTTVVLMKQEYPEEVYPPYANGPGYIISEDIAKYIVSQHVNQKLKVCRPERFLFFIIFLFLRLSARK